MSSRRHAINMLLSSLIASSIVSAEKDASGITAGFQLMEATIADAHTSMQSGELTCRQLVQRYLNRISVYDKNGPHLNTIQNINPNALKEAEQLDAALKSSGLVGPLHCIPVLLKDQVETIDMPTTYGSVIFKDFVPQRDATIVTRLKTAGAIILAKTNMGEFASRYMGSAFGLIRNAYDPGRNPSGSSGGTGSGIAANFGMVGIGEDTGGSIRGPAAVSNLVGLRPTVPLVSRYGMMPAKPGNDTLGPMTRTVKDAAILLGVLAGYDPNDPFTAYSVGEVPDSYMTFLRSDGLQEARIGVIREPMDPNADPNSVEYKKFREVINEAFQDLEKLGAELIDPITFPGIEKVKVTYINNVYETEEATNTYLAEHPNAPVKTLQEIVLSGKVTPWRTNSLMNVVGKSTKEQAYLQVLLAKHELRQSVLKIMADYEIDALVYATFDHPPSVIAADVLENPETEDLYGRGNNRYLSPVIGFPAVTIPAGFTDDDLPVAIEFLSRPFTEGLLLQFAYAYEQATHHRKPPATTPALPDES